MNIFLGEEKTSVDYLKKNLSETCVKRIIISLCSESLKMFVIEQDVKASLHCGHKHNQHTHESTVSCF